MLRVARSSMLRSQKKKVAGNRSQRRRRSIVRAIMRSPAMLSRCIHKSEYIHSELGLVPITSPASKQAIQFFNILPMPGHYPIISIKRWMVVITPSIVQRQMNYCRSRSLVAYQETRRRGVSPTRDSVEQGWAGLPEWHWSESDWTQWSQ